MSAKTSAVTQRLTITKKPHKTKPKQTHSDDMFSYSINLGSRGGKKPQLNPKTNKQNPLPWTILSETSPGLEGVLRSPCRASMEGSQAINLSISLSEQYLWGMLTHFFQKFPKKG